ncbi:MAG TPA: GAF domain-containing protein [Pyrinomonadaceae bacterium]|nr:GAF domain-containing protein [Pyrinomonadaceae bacterium]
MTVQTTETNANTKPQLYEQVAAQLRSLLEGEHDLIANAANCAALVYQSLEDINWAGFYLYKERQLVLGPFQGKPACIRINIGDGVCGTAAQLRQTIVVDNVHEFPGHIACDSASNSEIVVPLIQNESLIGVLDIDSPSLSRFDEDDARGLNQLGQIFVASLLERAQIDSAE